MRALFPGGAGYYCPPERRGGASLRSRMGKPKQQRLQIPRSDSASIVRGVHDIRQHLRIPVEVVVVLRSAFAGGDVPFVSSTTG